MGLLRRDVGDREDADQAGEDVVGVDVGTQLTGGRWPVAGGRWRVRMPTPASRAMARRDGSVSAVANAWLATASRLSRLRAASARSGDDDDMGRGVLEVQTEHVPVVLAWTTLNGARSA